MDWVLNWGIRLRGGDWVLQGALPNIVATMLDLIKDLCGLFFPSRRKQYQTSRLEGGKVTLLRTRA
jgi:hypothetical protein